MEIENKLHKKIQQAAKNAESNAFPGMEKVWSRVEDKLDTNVLKQEKIKPKELTMVKNYLMGSFLSMLDGPFNITSTARAMILQDKN